MRWKTLVTAERGPSRGLVLGVAELPPREPGRLHRHAHVEAYYVLSGRGTVVIDGAERTVRAGSAVFLPGGAEHGVRNTGPDPLRLVFVFAADALEEVEYEFSEDDGS